MAEDATRKRTTGRLVRARAYDAGDPEALCFYTEMKRTTKGKMKAAAESLRASSVEDVAEVKPDEDESRKKKTPDVDFSFDDY